MKVLESQTYSLEEDLPVLEMHSRMIEKIGGKMIISDSQNRLCSFIIGLISGLTPANRMASSSNINTKNYKGCGIFKFLMNLV